MVAVYVNSVVGNLNLKKENTFAVQSVEINEEKKTGNEKKKTGNGETMSKINLNVPINSLGYGVVGYNVWKYLSQSMDVTLFPIGHGIFPPI